MSMTGTPCFSLGFSGYDATTISSKKQAHVRMGHNRSVDRLVRYIVAPAIKFIDVH